MVHVLLWKSKENVHPESWTAHQNVNTNHKWDLNNLKTKDPEKKIILFLFLFISSLFGLWIDDVRRMDIFIMW